MADTKSQEDANKQMISDLKIKRGVVQMQLTKMKKYIETPGRSLRLAELQTRLSLVEELWSKFDGLQTKLECLVEEELESDKRETFEDSFITVKSKILELMEPKTDAIPLSPNATLDVTTTVKKNVRLPKLSIKKFSGRHVDWPDFYAKFKALIEDNEELTDVEKMSYLQESLEERPRKHIANLSLDRDFVNAIATLKARYDNKRLIYQAYIQEIVEAKPITKPSENELRDLVDVVESSLRALKKLATQKEIFEGMLLYIASLKLDSKSRSKWEDEIPAGTYPTWDEFVSFMERRCRSLETKNTSSSSALSKVSGKVGNSMKGLKPQHRKSFIMSKADSTCWFCKAAQHRIVDCDAFRKLSPSDRFQEIKAVKRCILCLQPAHSVKNCNLSSCEQCKNKHHTLLHFEKLHSPVNQSANVGPSSASTQAGLVMTSQSECAQPSESAFLATAIVLVKTSQGDYIPCRAVLDSGSTINLIAERVVQHLRLKKTKLEFQIGGVGSISLASKYKTDVSIKSRGYTANFEAHVLRNITGLLPSQSIPTTNWRIPNNITLADPKYDIPQSIDLLIGAGLFFELLSVGQIKLGNGLPVLQKTVFGWIVSGGRGTEGNVYHASLTKSSDEADKLEALVQRFWSIDNLEVKGKLLSPEQQACEEHFVKNTKRDELGRFSVELPFRKIPDNLGTSLDIAKKRFFNLEHKLSKSPQLKSQYYEFILEYATLGHMEMVPFQEIPPNHYFMPHHCVLKPQSSSTKLRVVFDASCKTSTGISLNDILMVGPVIQDDLYTLLIRFRSYKYALTADITKMYRQIVVRHPDTNYQYILCRSNAYGPINAYRLLTLTYGTAPASFIATRCLKQLAADGKDLFPLGSSIVERDFYVDDMITGADSISEALTIQEEVTKLLASGGFPLSKWCANAPELLDAIEENSREKYLSIDGDNVIKTLGMVWNPRQDQFRFSYNSREDSHSRITKRTVLAAIARLFDPIGLLSPIITKAKIFLQEIWKAKLDWDESLPQGLQQQWLTFSGQLQAVKKVKVPRYIIHRSSEIQVHGFADASMDAYGCCIYIRCEEGDIVHCNLLTARSKVAPLQTQSIARLELGALLLSETIRRVVGIFHHQISKVVCWSDSRNVLAWLSSSPSRWSVFIGNRVCKIQELTEDFSWKYISTENNPADIEVVAHLH